MQITRHNSQPRNRLKQTVHPGGQFMRRLIEAQLLGQFAATDNWKTPSAFWPRKTHEWTKISAKPVVALFPVGVLATSVSLLP
jgi:hypothetical protein